MFVSYHEIAWCAKINVVSSVEYCQISNHNTATNGKIAKILVKKYMNQTIKAKNVFRRPLFVLNTCVRT